MFLNQINCTAMVAHKDLVVGFKFKLGSVPCTIKHVSPDYSFASYIEDENTGEGMISCSLLLSKLNKR